METAAQNGPGGVNGNAGMSKAERFEDEKRRIVDSCFNKKDDDGSLIESYITHIRIIEDAAYPASPPPPNSNPSTKKPRLVIVAVRKSGRVRMHKARENANGTFSIGKTWMLDDLSAIQSYTGMVPQTPEEEQHKLWAGGMGFVVTLGKSYYWQANTQKEKQFFIASLVKIYTKYTGGKMPQLAGFEQREMDQLLGGTARSLPSSQTQSPSTPVPPYAQVQNRPPLRDPSREPGVRTQPSRDGMQRPSVQASPIRGPSPVGGPSPVTRPPIRSRRIDSPGDSFDAASAIPTQQSQPALRRLAGANQSQESFSRSDDAASLPPRSRGGLHGMPNAPGRFPDRNVTPISQRATTPESTFSSSKDISDDAPPVPAPLTLPPERRRPPLPIMGDSFQRAQKLDENIIPAPLASPGMRREDLRPPTRSSERNQPRDRDSDTMGSLSPQPNSNVNQVESPRSISDLKRSENTQSPLSAKSTSLPQSVISTPVIRTPVDNLEPEEETRPGLGPMIKQKSPLSEAPEDLPSAPAVETRPGLGLMIKTKSPIATSPMEPPPEPEGDARPGLGPMIRKKSKPEIANAFFNAAKSASALSTFKPRAGGAAEKLREAAAKAKAQERGPDGITGVIPAPRLVRATGSNSNLTTPTTTPAETPPALKDKEALPEVKIISSKPEKPTGGKDSTKPPQDNASPDKSTTRDAKRQKPASETMQKELAALGIDPIILGGKGHDLIAAWDEFGWSGEGVRTKNIDQMKEEIERELNKVQAGGWLNRLEEEDERVEAIKTGLDKCIDECDELDGLLTLYLVELSTLDEDIAFIEAQSQGLQVQAANQKLLQAELRSLLDTISISSTQLEGLSQASLESSRGLEQVESSLVILYKALLTIDPSLTLSGPRPSEDGSMGQSSGIGNSEIGSMQVLQEKKGVYRNEAATFLRRLKPFLQVKFAAAIDETRKVLEREKGSSLARVGKVKLDSRNHDLARAVLWKYSPLMLFAREVDRLEWEELIKTYELVARPLYQDEFRDAVFAWKRTARKPGGDESDILFTSQIEKHGEGIATTARKLTVKRSQTLAKTLRSPIGDNNSKTGLDKAGSDGKLPPNEVFSGVLDEMLPIVSMEQNFLVKFFHVTSLEQYDFPEAVAAAPPDERRGGDLRRPRVMEPNRDIAKQVVQSMEEIYSFFPGDVQSLVDWSLQSDPLQGVGLIATIERKLAEFEESSQEFLARTLQRQHARLTGLFSKFLDSQIQAIEDTKVKIKKRKGIIGFMRIFPSFSLALEIMLTSADNLEIRETVNHAYTRINKTMFESLKVIARENPSAQTAGTDPEDKEALNYQILLIENMNHYVEEVDARSNPVLDEWKQNAGQEMDEHMSLYVGAVIRRPLGKLLDFLESTESLMNSRQPGDPATKISGMTSHSKSTFQKVLAAYDSKEIKRGIETLKKRVEKHFGDADDPGLSRNLVAAVQGECEKYYEKVEDRILTISRDVYDGDVLAEWTRADVVSAFKRDR